MGPRRTLTGIKYLAEEGVRYGFDRDGWRILTPRTLGQPTLERARITLEKFEKCLPPEDPDRLEPFTLEEIGLHVAKTFDLRITHRIFRKH
jgi:hypothetical protein